MKNTFFDYPIFQIADLEEFSENLSGNCQKGVLVVVGDELTEERTIYMNRILGAVQLNVAEDCLLLRGYLPPQEGSLNPNLAKTLPSLGQLKAVQAAKQTGHSQDTPLSTVLFFGISPSRLGLNIQIPAYTPTVFNNMTLLHADRLADIEPSPERRKALWSALQQLFAV